MRIGVDVVKIGDRVLEHPTTIFLELEESERPFPAVEPTTVTAEELSTVDLEEDRPEVITLRQAQWYLVRGGIQREVIALARDGAPIFQDVDTTVYCYKLVCPKCGRARFAKRNCVYQITYCRVCTRQHHLRRRSLVQFRERARNGKQKRVPLAVQDDIVRRAKNELQADIAADLGLSASAVSRILRRRGAR